MSVQQSWPLFPQLSVGVLQIRIVLHANARRGTTLIVAGDHTFSVASEVIVAAEVAASQRAWRDRPKNPKL